MAIHWSAKLPPVPDASMIWMTLRHGMYHVWRTSTAPPRAKYSARICPAQVCPYLLWFDNPPVSSVLVTAIDDCMAILPKKSLHALLK